MISFCFEFQRSYPKFCFFFRLGNLILGCLCLKMELFYFEIGVLIYFFFIWDWSFFDLFYFLFWDWVKFFDLPDIRTPRSPTTVSYRFLVFIMKSCISAFFAASIISYTKKKKVMSTLVKSIPFKNLTSSVASILP